MEITRRYRVNISTSVKGIKTYDCTVEQSESAPNGGDGLNSAQLRSAILEESDALVAELEKRYPAIIEEAKK